MKRTIHVLLAALAVTALLAACAPAFEPELDEDFSREVEFIAQRYFKVSASGGSFQLQPEDNPTTQTITITTSAFSVLDDSAAGGDFNLYIDPALTTKNIPGVSLHPMTDGAQNGSTPAAINTSVTIDYIAVYSARDQVKLLIPQMKSSVVTTNYIALVVDSATASFNGPDNKKLNTDGDKHYGKDDIDADDKYVKYYSVTGNTAAAIAAPSPLSGYFPLPPIYDGAAQIIPANISLAYVSPADAASQLNHIGGTKLVLTGFEDMVYSLPTTINPKGDGTLGATGNAAYTNFDRSIITDAFKFQKFDYSTKAWVDITPAVADIVYDATNYPGSDGVFVLTFPAVSEYDFFRYAIDPYKIVEKEAVLGFKHRLSYDDSIGYATFSGGSWNKNTWSYPNWMVKNKESDKQYYTFTASNFAKSVEGIQGKYYISVTLNDPGSGALRPDGGTLSFVADSLKASNNNIRVFRQYSGSGDNRTIQLTIADTDIVRIGRNQFYIYLPAESVSTDTYQVLINGVQVNYKRTVQVAPELKESFANVKIANPNSAFGAIGF